MFDWTGSPGLPRWQFFVLHFAWWFPASLLVLPGLLFAPRKIIRPHEITFAEALPLCWMAVGFLPLLLSDHQSAYTSMSMWSAFALWAALVWERTPRALRIAGLALLVVAGGTMGAIALFSPGTFGDAVLPAVHLIEIASVALAVFALAGIYFAATRRSEIALLLVLVSMIPVGLCLIESASRMASSFSLAGAARFLNSHSVSVGRSSTKDHSMTAAR